MIWPRVQGSNIGFTHNSSMHQRTPLHDQDKLSCIKTPARKLATSPYSDDEEEAPMPERHVAFVTLADLDTPVCFRFTLSQKVRECHATKLLDYNSMRAIMSILKCDPLPVILTAERSTPDSCFGL